MRHFKVRYALQQSQKFSDLARLLIEGKEKGWEISGTKLSGAVRRASMELTRALAEMRKP
jgi:hypothetical protein